MVNKELDDDMGPSTRVLFMNTTKRLGQDSPHSSVNFRGIMDSVSLGCGIYSGANTVRSRWIRYRVGWSFVDKVSGKGAHLVHKSSRAVTRGLQHRIDRAQ